ncbi:YaiO family outer membrane beta-barrel protein [Maribacter sp. 2304DJ31-5]|uniref:YaiO family outer membrane beta-barrel protein n=1 Tax=Maribacter sp. 2304DJ31-5 TaxID=3386273 RepID=UPI0039BC302B
MKRIVFLLTIIHFLGIYTIMAQDATYSGNPDASFLTARELAFSGQRDMARDTLKSILTKYPDYIDVRCLMAKTYSWDNDHDEARLQFNRITSREKKNKEVWVAAIKNEQYAKNYTIALGLTNKALLYLEDDGELLGLHAQILKQIEAQQLLQNILKETKKEDKSDQSITLYTQGEFFDEGLDAMYYGALEYKKKTKWGVLIPRLNFNRRFNNDGIQAEMDAYPRFSKTLSGYFNYGFSGSKIFPRHRIGGEVLKELPKALEVSLGFRHLSFENDNATILTGTFGLYRGNYYAVLRPYVVPDAREGVGVSGNLLIRKYLRDGNNFMGLNLVYGFDTELNQFIVDGALLAETLLYLESQKLRFEYQFSNSKSNNIYKTNLGVNRQELAFSSGKFFWSVTAGIAYELKF